MRRTIIGALAAIVALSAGVARADKAANAFIDPSSVDGGANGFANAYCLESMGVCTGNVPTKTYSVGSAKTSGCKTKLQFKGLSGFVDGELMICIAGADACIAIPPLDCLGGMPPNNYLGNSVVMHVKYSSLSLKAATKADFGKIGCGSTDAIARNAAIHCYKFDGGYNPATTCSGQGGLWLPHPLLADMDPLNDPDPATDGLIGVCQWFTPGGGQRLTPPGTGLVAQDGLATPDKP